MKRLWLVIVGALALAACSAGQPVPAAPDAAAGAKTAERAVNAELAESGAGWNAGDLDRFLMIYSAAPETSFVLGDSLLRGKAALARHYQQAFKFDDPARRGTLSIEQLDFRMLGPDNALYIGRYHLAYPDGKQASGPTSLVFVHEADGWRIIADHSS